MGLLSLMLLLSCGNDLDKIDTVELPDRIPDSLYKDFQIIYSDSAEVKVLITGKVLKQFGKTDTTNAFEEMLDSVHMIFYDEHKVPQNELFADYAKREQNSDQMEAKGHVVVVNIKGEKLETEHLIWNEKTKRISSDTDVKITQVGGKIIKGKGMEADQNFNNYTITKVVGEIPFEREEKPE